MSSATGAHYEGAVASWSASGTTLEAVEAAVERLRHQEEQLATRTSVVNLVVVASDQDSIRRTGSAMRRLGARHPGRTLLLLLDRQAPAGIDAEVTFRQAVAEGHAIWWEQLTLVVRGSAADHLESLVAPLLLAHLPLAAWFPAQLPAPGEPLAGVADAVLVDSRFAEPLGGGTEEPGDRAAAFAALVELSRRHPVVDLSWKRLTPWRELLAGLFDPPALRGYVSEVRSATVRAQPGPRRLLAGWLVSQLGLAPDAVVCEDALHASVELLAGGTGEPGSFTVERDGDERSVTARAVIRGEEVLCQRQSLPEHGLTWSLARALSRLGHDLTYEHAVASALHFER
ncbi:MAG: glucose-6-phosphate dehydrogenase assembly protein OpcA [Acidimicrobiales bacterium]